MAHGAEARKGRFLVDTTQIEQTERTLIDNDMDDSSAPLTLTPHQEAIGFADEKDGAYKVRGKSPFNETTEEESDEEDRETEGLNSAKEKNTLAREMADIKDEEEQASGD